MAIKGMKPLNRLISLLRAEFPGTFRIHGDRLTGKLSDADRLWMETQGGFSLVTDNDEKSQAGVKNDADLASRAEASVPGLKRILSERSLTAADDSPSGMMDVLYQSFLEGD